MLPLLRILPVGGVFLAIMIVVLALNPPGDTDSPLPPHARAPARGPLADIAGHPEWRQFLIMAALRRADEIERLRDLPDTPVRVPEVVAPAPEVVLPEPAATPAEPLVETPPAEAPVPPLAALPTEKTDSDPEDITGSVTEETKATMQVDIGAASSSELPIVPVPEEPPVIKMPEVRPPQKSERKPTRPVRRAAKPPAPKPQPATPNLLEALFGRNSTETASTEQR